MGEVKLLGTTTSPYSCRVEIALKLKGIKYEFIQEDLKNKSELLLKSNPVLKKVPVLIHHDHPIAESLVILEYIDEAFPGTPILPRDPFERAKARFWAKFIDDKCLASARKVVRVKGEELEKAKEEVEEDLRFLEDELGGKKFFGGDNINLVDITADNIAYWFGVMEEVSGVKILEEDKYPRLCGWIKRYLDCEAVKESLPPRDKLLARLRELFEAFRASG